MPRYQATVSLQEQSLSVRRDEDEPNELLPLRHNECNPLSLRLSTTSQSHGGGDSRRFLRARIRALEMMATKMGTEPTIIWRADPVTVTAAPIWRTPTLMSS
ncbi:hypothetical protein GN958_ATG19840 [Phytophthora infestans]|uniref:Uncharacterized protein n=1 Tax=Phytophthora infestans TaxID=4787 RepID=A0A8S9TR60_PHYIN|nr:hypothetical protein GN958_ATG19840 [Phytophthora infestans]